MASFFLKKRVILLSDLNERDLSKSDPEIPSYSIIFLSWPWWSFFSYLATVSPLAMESATDRRFDMKKSFALGGLLLSLGSQALANDPEMVVGFERVAKCSGSIGNVEVRIAADLYNTSRMNILTYQSKKVEGSQETQRQVLALDGGRLFSAKASVDKMWYQEKVFMEVSVDAESTTQADFKGVMAITPLGHKVENSRSFSLDCRLLSHRDIKLKDFFGN